MSKKKSKGKRTTPKTKAMKLIAADDPLLHSVALFADPSPELHELGKRLVATAIKHNGLAVAAPQVGVNVRLIGLANGLVVLNPSVGEPNGRQIGREGCLSYPNRWWLVERANWVTVIGLHPKTGMPLGPILTEGLAARMWQHELDHLDGLVLDGRFPEQVEA